jgi:hypothetical protein
MQRAADAAVRCGRRAGELEAQRIDEQIESLLASVKEPDAAVPAPSAVPERPVRARPRRRRLRRRNLTSSYDLLVAVTAVVLGLAVGVLTVILVNA